VHAQEDLWLCSKDIVWATLCMLHCYEIRHNKPIRLDEIELHWHKLYMGKEESNEEFFQSWRSGVVFRNVSKESDTK